MLSHGAAPVGATSTGTTLRNGALAPVAGSSAGGLAPGIRRAARPDGPPARPVARPGDVLVMVKRKVLESLLYANCKRFLINCFLCLIRFGLIQS